MNKTWIILSGAAAITVLGGAYYLHAQHVRDAAGTAAPPDVYIGTASKGDITQSAPSPGQVASNLDIAIKCQASGPVIEMPFDISDHVKKGDILMKLDPIDEDILRQQAEATLAQSQSKFTEAQQAEQQAEVDLQNAKEKAADDISSDQVMAANLKKKADRQKTLLDKNLASPEDYETAQSDYEQSKDTLEAAQIAQEAIKSQEIALETKKEDIKLAQDQVDLDTIAYKNAVQQESYCTVTSPIDGVVGDIPTTIGLGTIISSAISNIGGGTTIMTLSDLSKIFVLATVDESDIGGVQVGQDVHITADSFPGKQFEGKVVRIATEGVTSSNVVTFEVKIEVTSENKGLLKPQMTANVDIIEAQKTGVVIAPELAVIHQKKRTYVTIQNPDGSTTDRDVVTGINDGDNIEIVSGLSGGEQVMVYKNEAANHWTGQGPGQRPISMPSGGGRRG